MLKYQRTLREKIPFEGIGLHTMATRARVIGGSLKLRQGDPQGTVVVCSFPLP